MGETASTHDPSKKLTHDPLFTLLRAALTGKHDTLVRRAHQMLNAALTLLHSHWNP